MKKLTKSQILNPQVFRQMPQPQPAWKALAALRAAARLESDSDLTRKYKKEGSGR